MHGFYRFSETEISLDCDIKYSIADKFVVALNGEIYNSQSIKVMLETKGHIFETDSVCEILLHLYQEYNTGMFCHLRGMFAFAIYDIQAKKIFCARDPFGIKQLYYAPHESGFYFGTKIVPALSYFETAINTEALGQYLTFQYSVLPETFFKGIFKLPQGHFLMFEDGQISVSRYHSHVFTPFESSDITEDIDKAVCDSVSSHLENTEEVGTFLSGGVDSSYIAAVYASQNKKGVSFTVGFDYEKYNEVSYAKSLSDKLGLTHITKIISTDEYWNSLAKIQLQMEEPMADPAAVAFYFACEEAAKHVNIAFSGEGADELFGGYNIYKEPLSLKTYSRLPLSFREWLASIVKRLPAGTRGRSFIIRGAKPVEERFVGNAYIFSEEERAKILKYPTIQSPTDITRPFYNQVKHEDDVTKMQFLDIHLWLEGDILCQANKMSEANGLQLRTPFLDREVARTAFRLPVKHRVSKKTTKIAFRKAAAKHLSPETAERYKLGFPVPTRIWLREQKYYDIVKEYFVNCVAEKYFNTTELINLLDEHFTGKQDNSRKIWTVYMFLVWHEEMMSALKKEENLDDM